ncbi:MAG: ABC transporter substrate-binding protein [Lachnospiraceae bacterium]|nr:ABC transporter substrate-binding protein [Lachnospiraceae bacterium]
MKTIIKSGLRIVGLIAVLGVINLTGCSEQEEASVTQEVESEVVIPVIFRVDPETNVSDNKAFADEFNQEYEGTYRIEVEWLTESAAGYRNKIKQWNVLDKMPAVVVDAGFDNDFYQVMVENDRLVDLRPYMEQSDFWLDAMNPDILRDSTEADGSVYLSPLGSSVYSYAGLIYNEELLRRAGYEKIPETWEEFLQCLDALKEEGITPLALHGSGSYWVPMLIGTAYMERTQEGRDFLSEDFPDSFQNQNMQDMLEMLKLLYQYSYEDAVEIDYEQAANRFLNDEVAIIANGYWMFDTMTDEMKEKMRFTYFPEGVLMNSPRMGAWAVSSGYDEDVIEGAVKVLEYRIASEQPDLDELLNGAADSTLEASYAEAVKAVRTVMPNYQMKWEQEIQNEFFTEYMPELLAGEIETEEFLQLMDERNAAIRQRK